MPDPTLDRLAALRRLGLPALADLLRAVPGLADAVDGRGPLSRSWPWGFSPSPRRLDLRGLAQALGSERGVDLALASLDATTLALAELAAWHGGSLTREQALAETGPELAAALDVAAATLGARLLTDPEAGWVALRAGVTPMVALPGVPAAAHLHALRTERLAETLAALGLPVPHRKGRRVQAVLEALRDPDLVAALVQRMPAEVRRVFELLCVHGPQRLADLGVPYLPPSAAYRSAYRSAYQVAPSARTVEWLLDHGLVGVDYEAQVCLVWLDVLVALRGGQLFGDAFPRPVPAEPVPLRAPPPALPPTLEHLDALLALWRASPAEALATGGLGVKSVRAAAKALGLPSGEVGLLANLAVVLGLLGVAEVGASGRGRNRKVQRRWAPTSVADAWSAEPAGRRWALLVQAWTDDVHLDEAEGLPERREAEHHLPATPAVTVARGALLALLAGLPPGTGLAADQVEAIAAAQRPALLDPPRTRGLAAALRALGLAPAEGPLGLTDIARALLDGPEAVEKVLPAPRHEVIVQADLTVLAPPDVAPEVTATLARWADLESSAGARMYRLSERRLAAALDAGEDAEQVLAWLTEHSTVPIAQNVAYLVRDVARRSGRLRAGTATTYLRCDDAGLLAQAVAVRAAKLRLLAPTVAVSGLSRERLLAALRDRGVSAVAEDAEGATVAGVTATAHPVGLRSSSLPALRAPVDLAEEATRLLAASAEPELSLEDHEVLDRLKRRSREEEHQAPEWLAFGDELFGLVPDEEDR